MTNTVTPGYASPVAIDDATRLQTIFDRSPLGITIVDPGGYFVDANPAFMRMLGYDVAELRALRFADISVEENFALSLALFRDLVAGHRDGYQVEKQYRKRDGGIVSVRLTITAIRAEDGTLRFALGMAEDITHRRAMATLLEESEARYQTLIETLPVIVYLAEPDPPFRSIYVSPGIAILGYTLEEWLANPRQWEERLHPDDRERVIAEAVHASTGNRPFNSEYRILARDGSVRWFSDRGEFMRSAEGVPLAWQGLMADITDRKAREDAMRFQASLLDAVNQAVIAVDRHGEITSWNRHAEKLYGWTREEAAGRTVEEVFGLTGDEVHAERMMRNLAGATTSAEHRRRCKDGTMVTVSSTTSPIVGGTGEITGVISVSADITERRALEEQLRHSQKMEAVGKLAGGIAHDFNNLLTVIRANAEFLREQPVGSDDWRNDVEEILKASTRAAALTRQLLAFSRKQLLQPRHLLLNGVVEGMAPMLRRIVGEDVDIVVHLDPGLPTVHADPGQLEQVLVNLVVNARDALPGGGTITIATQAIGAGESRNHPAGEGATTEFATGPQVILSVRDNGVGMDEATRLRVFEPFFTTKEVGQGTGLGLSMVYGIVKQSGGLVRVESRRGEGTLFEVLLPVSDMGAEPDRAVDHPPVGGTETILLVEDADPVRKLAERVLTQGGYRVLSAAGGVEALAIARTFGGRIDLLLTDMVMPGMNGRELAEAFAAVRPGVAVMLMSGYTDDEMMRRGLHDPDLPFVEKPFTTTRLTDAVRAHLDAQRDVQRG